MATKKVVKRKAEVRVVEITAEQFLAGIEKFNRVCDFVDSHMGRDVPDLPTDAPTAYKSAMPKPPSNTVEQMAYEVRNFAADIQKMVEELRAKLCYGGGVNQSAAENTVAPSEGPIKDTLNGTQSLLRSMHRDLLAISEYVSN